MVHIIFIICIIEPDTGSINAHLFAVPTSCVDMFNVKYYIKSESSFCTLFALSHEAVRAVFICIYLLSLPLESQCSSNNSNNFMHFLNIISSYRAWVTYVWLFIVKMSLYVMKSQFELLLACRDITLSPRFCDSQTNIRAAKCCV